MTLLWRWIGGGIHVRRRKMTHDDHWSGWWRPAASRSLGVTPIENILNRVVSYRHCAKGYIALFRHQWKNRFNKDFTSEGSEYGQPPNQSRFQTTTIFVSSIQHLLPPLSLQNSIVYPIPYSPSSCIITINMPLEA